MNLLTVAAYVCLFFLCCTTGFCATGSLASAVVNLAVPQPGAHELRLITPNILELTLVSSKKPEPAKLQQWDFVDANGTAKLPKASDFEVTANGDRIRVEEIGFRRRVLYAPLKKWDLRVASTLYLRLGSAIPADQTVEVLNPRGRLWPATLRWVAAASSNRLSPAIHVNQTGYLPKEKKRAMAGYYLGSLGELPLRDSKGSGVGSEFILLEAARGREVYRGKLVPRPDRGFTFRTYQEVLEADFSEFNRPGEYELKVAGLGKSFPFRIDEGMAAGIARTYALGLYHQRCGTSNALPWTRFVHGPCHTAPAQVPDDSKEFEAVQETLAKETANARDERRHTAPQLKTVSASLYPWVNRGPVQVSGGHHDAGDYSKYTINSAGFIHLLLFAVDNFPGAGRLDNLGVPESGDGVSDLLQEVKWEADFLARMQDADGGFYFLVYPRDRSYELDVLPDRGDPQVVFPKTTSATAAATAALAQCASSPAFKKHFPDAAAAYLAKARKGWTFLQQALRRFGHDGAYQKITHYGDEFMHDDELAWAACEMYLATGDTNAHHQLLTWLKPADPATRKWGWLRLYDAYGAAIRSYAFAARSGRVSRDSLKLPLLRDCEDEIIAAGQDHLERAKASAYGTSFAIESKRARTAGWYFACDSGFDLAVASQLDYPAKNDPRPAMLDALLSTFNYEQGCNPVNVTYLTGLGWKRQCEIVHQYAQNDARVIPLSGIPLGNVQEGVSWNNVYGKEPNSLSYPRDSDAESPYPLYDRWSDAFNLSQEFVILHQAKGLGCWSWLMARGSLANQPWRGMAAFIAPEKQPILSSTTQKFTLLSEGVDLSSAQVVWEAPENVPVITREPSFVVPRSGSWWVEAEAYLPDGRRLHARTNVDVTLR